MYPVSNAYREIMAGQIRGKVSLEGEIYSAAIEVQTGIKTTSDNALPECDVSALSKIVTDPKINIASLEQDYMRSDGTYSFAEGNTVMYYISNTLSSNDPDENGEYPIVGSSVTIEPIIYAGTIYWGAHDRTLSILCDDSVARISITVDTSYGSAPVTTECVAVDGMAIAENITEWEYWRSCTINVVSLKKPNQRARIYRVAAGKCYKLTPDQICSMQYTDQNDSVGIVLPSKTVRLSINNLDRTFAPETEYQHPSFLSGETVLCLRLGIDLINGVTEWVILPKMYLRNYSVGEETVDFDWYDAIGRLNEDDATHYYSYPYSNDTDAVLTKRAQEVMKVSIGSEDVMGWVRTAADKLGITLDTASAANPTSVIHNPCPIITSAQALQLYSNVSGNILRTKRTGDTLEFVQPPDSAVMHIGLNELWRLPEWSAEDSVSTLSLNMESTGSETETKVIGEHVSIHHTYAQRFITDAPIRILTAESDPPVTISAIAKFAYCWYLYAFYSDEYMQDGKVKAELYKVMKNQKEAAVGRTFGRTISVSNPLLDDTLESIMTAHMKEAYQYPIVATISHRGYPELDAGDVITLETETQEAVRVRILENSFEIKEGAMSGSTKARRLE